MNPQPRTLETVAVYYQWFHPFLMVSNWSRQSPLLCSPTAGSNITPNSCFSAQKHNHTCAAVGINQLMLIQSHCCFSFLLRFMPQGWIDNFNGPSGVFIAVSKTCYPWISKLLVAVARFGVLRWCHPVIRRERVSCAPWGPTTMRWQIWSLWMWSSASLWLLAGTLLYTGE